MRETKKSGTPKLQKLQSLAEQPGEQAAYALELLQSEKDRQVLEAALRILVEQPQPEARPILLERYQHYAADGPRLDMGATLRVALLRALRPLARQADRPLLEKAVTTYEAMPSQHDAQAAALRSIALVVLSDLDESLTNYYAVRLLADKITSEMSGEPALTAATVLAEQGQVLPLYQYLLGDNERYGEVVATCLRVMSKLPASLLPGLVERYRRSSSDIILVGLFDLLFTHREGASFSAVLTDFLADTPNSQMYRYLALKIITGPQPQLVADLLKAAQHERSPLKLAALKELLPLVKGHEAEVAALLKRLDKAK